MLKIEFTARMKRDTRRMLKRGRDISRLEAVIDALAKREPLPEKLRDHALTGPFSGFRECHIEPDWLLIYRVDGARLILIAAATGTHSDLFGE